VYDMYPWDTSARQNNSASAPRADDRPAARQGPRLSAAPAAAEPAARPAGTATGPAGPAEPDTPAILAVQVALDRRDNGGAAADRARQ
jgi:hypothetical protein